MDPVVVLAGGLGTRVAALTGGTVPKALLDVAGKPFLDRKLDELKAQGVDRVVLLVGHGGALLREHVERTGHGLDVQIVEDGPALLGTAGAIAAALDRLPARFWVTYGDTFLEAPMAAIEADFAGRGADGLMTVLRNEDRWQPSNVSVDSGLVVAYDKAAVPGRHRYIDYGLLLLTGRAFDVVAPGDVADLRVVLEGLIARRSLLAHEVTERFHDVGTPEALAETAAWIRSREQPPGR